MGHYGPRGKNGTMIVFDDTVTYGAKWNIIGRDIMDHFHLAALSIPFYTTGVNVLNDPHPIYPGHLELRFK